jgi:hypothetical protein
VTDDNFARGVYRVWSLVLALVLCAAALMAQESQPAAPKLTEDEILMVQTVQSLGKVAAESCQALDTVKSYNTQRDRVAAKVSVNHPGYIVDWSTTALVAKPQGAK